jgi:DNA-binding response OmpR family regulator
MTSTQFVPLRGTRVLVAEDDALLALEIVCLLRNAGAEVLGPAKTLAAALVLAKTNLLSCAVLDVDLRGETVFPAARLLKDRGVRIIFHTGFGEPDLLRREWPDAKVLTKPSSLELMIRTVREASLDVEFGSTTPPLPTGRD